MDLPEWYELEFEHARHVLQRHARKVVSWKESENGKELTSIDELWKFLAAKPARVWLLLKPGAVACS